MIGLSLEGGGIKGSYQAGAYLAFKKCHVKFDGIVGTSIGSFNGAMIAANCGDKMVEIWQNLDVANALCFDQDKGAKLKKKNPLVYIDFFKDILKNKGISTDGIQKLVAENLDYEKLMASKVEYGLCTVRVKDLKPLYLMKEDLTKNNINKYIMNSCYLPIFKMEKTVDDSYFLDGGFYDNAPYNMLINKGYDTIYNVGMHGIGFTRKPSHDVKIINIKPIRSTGGILTFNKDKIHESIKMGYYDTLRVLKNYDGYNYVFKHRNKLYYKRMLKKISKRELRRVKNFFFAQTDKQAIVYAVEYVMQREKIDYYKIYNIRKEIKKIKKNYEKDNFVYNFVRNLRVL